jgi:hypothetical protein
VKLTTALGSERIEQMKQANEQLALEIKRRKKPEAPAAEAAIAEPKAKGKVARKR